MLVWLVASLTIAAGMGWVVTVDERGIVLGRTWLCIPLTRRQFARGTPVTVDDDAYAPEHADFSRWVQLGDGEGGAFGTASNADDIHAVLAKAMAHHQR